MTGRQKRMVEQMAYKEERTATICSIDRLFSARCIYVLAIIASTVLASTLIAGVFTSSAIATPNVQVQASQKVESTNSSPAMFDIDSAQASVPYSISFTTQTKKLKAGKTFTFKVSVSGGPVVNGASTTNGAASNNPATNNSASSNPAVTPSVVWSVSNKKIATIDQRGKLTGKRVGAVIVSAVYGTAKTQMKVKITPKKIIALDPGHSGRSARGMEPVGPGSSNYKLKDSGGTVGVVTHIPEWKLNLAVAKKLKKELEGRGYKIVMTRYNNTTPVSNVQRAKIANRAKADIFIRLHADGIDVSSVHGVSVHHPTKSNRYVGRYAAKSTRLSQCVLRSVCKATGAKSGGSVGRNDLTGSNWAKMPVTLVEVGFMSNPTEDRKLARSSYQKKIARGIANGVDTYFKKSSSAKKSSGKKASFTKKPSTKISSTKKAASTKKGSSIKKSSLVKKNSSGNKSTSK